jgi:hypothetical protein
MAYSKIMEAWRRDKISRLKWIYIDAYAGPGQHLSKTTGETVEGSPLIALNTDPPFHEYHFIDTEPARAKQLRELAVDRSDVHTYTEDAQKRHLKRRLKSGSQSDIQLGLGERLRCPVPEGTDEHQLQAGIAQRLGNGSSGKDRLGKLRRRRHYRRDRQPYNHTRSHA